MRQHRLAVRNFRGTPERSVAFAERGVTVVEGPNESGKSSLAEALDLLLGYQAHSKAQAVRRVQPAGEDVGSEVTAELSCGPYRFTYSKRFNREHATTLTIHEPEPEQLTGGAAHDRVAALLAEHVDEALWRALRIVQDVPLEQADLSAQSSLAAALESLAGPAVFYLALPNVLFADALRALADLGMPAGSRLVIEKPFGTSAADARALNELIGEVVAEDAVFRIDHFLAKQTVLNLLGLRFANRVFEPVWNSVHVERVDIVWDETLGLEGRAGYYDRAGALRDMVQNHLLQLLSLVAMEPPTDLGERALRDRKVDVLHAVRSLSGREVVEGSRRGRYAAGRIGDRELPDYVAEPGVDPARCTETYAEVTLFVDNWRWSGVPFRLRSGKALAAGRREIVLHFRPVPHLPFAGGAAPDVLRLSLDPDAIALAVNLNGAGEPFDLEREELAVDLARRLRVVAAYWGRRTAEAAGAGQSASSQPGAVSLPGIVVQGLNHGLHVVRQRCIELQHGSGRRVLQGQCTGVQCLAAEVLQRVT
jgi:glucose-6-phosphate 1-dehydrogenase